ncbi:MAG: hypothetical protein JXQ75_22665 [Phycisphaerae bacterium]|nr:hypothetical protein [Phycisphaerae bacterium]
MVNLPSGKPDVPNDQAHSTRCDAHRNNFAISVLAVRDEQIGLVQLVDDSDNGSGKGGRECFFLHEHSITEESKLDRHGLLLYVEGNVESMLTERIGDADDGRLLDSTYVARSSWWSPKSPRPWSGGTLKWAAQPPPPQGKRKVDAYPAWRY